jgi:hypothetical protein
MKRTVFIHENGLIEKNIEKVNIHQMNIISHENGNLMNLLIEN